MFFVRLMPVRAPARARLQKRASARARKRIPYDEGVSKFVHISRPSARREGAFFGRY